MIYHPYVVTWSGALYRSNEAEYSLTSVECKSSLAGVAIRKPELLGLRPETELQRQRERVRAARLRQIREWAEAHPEDTRGVALYRAELEKAGAAR